MAEKKERKLKPINSHKYKLGIICLTIKQVAALGFDPDKVTTKDLREYFWKITGLKGKMDALKAKEDKEKPVKKQKEKQKDE